MDQKPSIGRIVHYVSYGTPNGEYGKECRAAIITALKPLFQEDKENDVVVSLCVLNPTGQFFNERVYYDVGSEVVGDPDCPAKMHHGNPMRYCTCGWQEAHLKGGTWHWPERN